MDHPPTSISSNLTFGMEAANALSSLVDEESSGISYVSEAGKNPGADKFGAESAHAKNEISSKRYLPDHKKPDAALTFPEKLMAVMRYADQQKEGFCIAWLADGKSFIIRDAEVFTKQVVPRFFKPTKFSSFTRKLYRWGFRQINRGIGQEDPIVFGNDNFVRGQPELMSKMRSTTAAATRKAEEMPSATAGIPGMPPISLAGTKRSAEVADVELQQQLLLRQLLSKRVNVGQTQQEVQQFQDPQDPSGIFGGSSCNNCGHGSAMMGSGACSVNNSQACFGGVNSNNMSLSQMIQVGNNFSAGNINTAGGGVVSGNGSFQRSFRLGDINDNNNSCNNNIFFEQQQLLMQQQQSQNNSLLGSINMAQERMAGLGSQQPWLSQGGGNGGMMSMGNSANTNTNNQCMSTSSHFQETNMKKMMAMMMMMNGSNDGGENYMMMGANCGSQYNNKSSNNFFNSLSGSGFEDDFCAGMMVNGMMSSCMPQDKLSGVGGCGFGSQGGNSSFMSMSTSCSQPSSGGTTESSLLGHFAPVRRQPQSRNNTLLQPPQGMMIQELPNSATTAEIVDAAINALKYS